MSKMLQIPAELRERAGKGASRHLRNQGRVPAIIYGNKQPPIAVHVEAKLLIKLLNTGSFFDSELEIELNGEKILGTPKDVQFHPVNDRPLHMDILRK